MPDFIGDPQELQENQFISSNNLNFSNQTVALFKPNRCSDNAYYAAEANNDLIVEGILIVRFDNKKKLYFTPHCWNKHGDNYYDVTKDFIWNTDGFSDNLSTLIPTMDVEYEYLSCCEYSHHETSYGVFKYTYDTLMDYIKSKVPPGK